MVYLTISMAPVQQQAAPTMVACTGKQVATHCHCGIWHIGPRAEARGEATLDFIPGGTRGADAVREADAVRLTDGQRVLTTRVATFMPAPAGKPAAPATAVIVVVAPVIMTTMSVTVAPAPVQEVTPSAGCSFCIFSSSFHGGRVACTGKQDTSHPKLWADIRIAWCCILKSFYMAGAAKVVKLQKLCGVRSV